jgi:hypothetical protein
MVAHPNSKRVKDNANPEVAKIYIYILSFSIKINKVNLKQFKKRKKKCFAKLL